MDLKIDRKIGTYIQRETQRVRMRQTEREIEKERHRGIYVPTQAETDRQVDDARTQRQ